MVASTLVIQMVDGLAKHLSAGYSPLFIGWARYAAASLIVVPYAALLHGWRIFPAERTSSHILRTVLLVTAMTLYFMAIAHIPLAAAISAYFVARPQSGVDPGILLAIGGSIAYALYMVVTRRMALISHPLKTLVFQCVAGMVLLTPQALLTWTTPALADLPAFLGLGLLSLLAHFMLIAAFRLAETSVLAPLVYVELIGAALIGYVAFGEVPGPATWAGAALIVAAGMLVLIRRKDAVPAVDEPVA
ncbi:MAG: DMT family transporter [Mesorhizobium sp.]|nr:DMT family transporter [Mesorhizobium sp.]MBN9242567.1 DMT family transporter [Mesorhizobium sp.]MBN9273412.1 DMT family transporter [Mesorhizobium sp.]